MTALVVMVVATATWSAAAAPPAVQLGAGHAPAAFDSAAVRAGQAEPASAVQLAALAAKVPHSSLTYLPVKPCRILNTAGPFGALPANGTRTIRVKGSSGFAAQGGASSGCGIPQVADAVEMVFKSTASSAAGYLRAWPASDAEPAYAVLTFSHGEPTSGTSTVPVSGSTTGGNLKVRSHNASTQMTIDVVGYYMAPIAAAVAGNGTLISATDQISTVAHTSTGDYRILTRSFVTNCTVLTTPLWGNVTVTARISTSGFVPVIEVLTRNNATGQYGNYSFYLQVVC